MDKPSTNEAALLKGALQPTLIVGAVAMIISTVLQGRPGFAGALLAQAVVLIYFVVHIFISKISRILFAAIIAGLVGHAAMVDEF